MVAHPLGITDLKMGEERIDLRNLKQRELLILVHSKVESIEADLSKVKQCNQELLLKVNTMETKSKIWGSISGALAGAIVTGLLSLLLDQLLKS